MTSINPDWWKTLFDETYLITDARSVCDDDVTCLEVDFLEQALGLKKAEPILDLCGGQGRHSLELSRRGFTDVTVLDYSQYLINRGRKAASKEGRGVQFIRGDARDSGLPDQAYRFIFVMANSFGYFVDEKEDERLLREAFRLLMPQAFLLLDLTNRDYVLKNFSPHTWHEANDEIVVCRQRSLENDLIIGREVVISKERGLIRDESYCARLYSDKKISELLHAVGFRSITIQKDFVSHTKKSDYGCMNNRMIVTAQRP